MARIDLGGNFVFRGIDTPTADNDAASKEYVDSRPGVIALEIFFNAVVSDDVDTPATFADAQAALDGATDITYDASAAEGSRFSNLPETMEADNTVTGMWSETSSATTRFIARHAPPADSTTTLSNWVVTPAGSPGAAGPEGPFRVDTYFVQQSFAEFFFTDYTPQTDALSYQFNIFGTPNTTVSIQTPANATLAQVRTALTDGLNDAVILGQYSYRAITQDVPNGFALRIFFDQDVTMPVITRQDLTVRLTQILVLPGLTAAATPFGTLLPAPPAGQTGLAQSSSEIQDAPTEGPTGAMYDAENNVILMAPIGWSIEFPTDIVNDVVGAQVFSSFSRYVPADDDEETVLLWSVPFEVDRRGPPGPPGPSSPVVVVNATTAPTTDPIDVEAGSFVLVQAGSVEELYYFVDGVDDVSINTDFRFLTTPTTDTPVPPALLLTVNETGGTSFEQLTDTPNTLGDPGQVVAASARTFPTFRADWQLGLSTQLGRFSIAPFNNEIRLNLNAVSSDSVNEEADVVAAANTRGAVVIIAEQGTENIIIEGNVLGNVDLHSIDTVLIDEPLTTGAITDLTDGTGYTIYIGPRSQTLEFVDNNNIPDYDPAVLTSGGYAPGSTVYVATNNTAVSATYRGFIWFVPRAMLDTSGEFTQRTTNVITAPGIGPDWTTRTPIQLADTAPFPNTPPFVTLSDIIGTTDDADTDASARTNGGDGFPGTVVESEAGITYVYRPGGTSPAAGADGEGWYYFDGATLDPNDGLTRTADGELAVDHTVVPTHWNTRRTYAAGSTVFIDTGASGPGGTRIRSFWFTNLPLTNLIGPPRGPITEANGQFREGDLAFASPDGTIINLYEFTPVPPVTQSDALPLNAMGVLDPNWTLVQQGSANWQELTIDGATGGGADITQGTAFPTENLELEDLFILTAEISADPTATPPVVGFGAGLYRLTRLPDDGPPVVTVQWTLVANVDNDNIASGNALPAAADSTTGDLFILRANERVTADDTFTPGLYRYESVVWQLVADNNAAINRNVTIDNTDPNDLMETVTPVLGNGITAAEIRTLLETERVFNLTPVELAAMIVAQAPATEPALVLRENDIWIDSTDGRASVYTDSQWLQIAGKERVGGSDFDLGTFTAPINIDLPFGTEGHPSLNPAFPLGVVNDNFGTGRDAQWVPGTRTFQVALDAETLTGINFISLTDDPNDDATAVITESRIINVPGGFGLLLTGTLTPEGEAWWNDQTTTGTTVQYLDGLANVYRAAHDGAYLPNPDVIRLDLGGY